MSDIEIRNLDVMWKGLHEVADATAMVLATDFDTGQRIITELRSREADALAAGDKIRSDFIGYGRAMFEHIYRNHLATRS